MEEIKKLYEEGINGDKFGALTWDGFVMDKFKMWQFIEKVYKLGEENGKDKTVKFIKKSIVDILPTEVDLNYNTTEYQEGKEAMGLEIIEDILDKAKDK